MKLISHFNIRSYYLLVMFSFCLNSVFGQSIFESSLNELSEEQQAYQIGGYVRTDLFSDEHDFRSVYSELSLQIGITRIKYGKAYADMRLKKDLINDENTQIELREGYVDLTFNKIDFRVGQQIIVWGRADGFNPTNNITPRDYSIFSPNEDDHNLANFVVSGSYNFYPWCLSFDWVPIYRTSILPLNSIGENLIKWGQNKFPEHKLLNSNIATKLAYEGASFDGSISYFRGYNNLAGIDIDLIDSTNIVLCQSAHKTQIFGADFSTTIASFGIRGEFAYTVPEDKLSNVSYIPTKQLEYTLGIDKEWGNLCVIAQYIGKYLPSFESQTPTLTSMYEQLLSENNKMLFLQTKQWLHGISLRPSLKILHETLSMQVLSLYYLNTDEIFIKPLIEYELSGNISLKIGSQMYFGPDGTLFNVFERQLNSLFVECKIYF